MTHEASELFQEFFADHYRQEIAELAQRYPNEQRSLHVDYDDLSNFNHQLAQDMLNQPTQMREHAENALERVDLPADISLHRTHVRVRNLPETLVIDGIRVHDNHTEKLVAIQGIVRKATEVRPEITEAAFECQRCGSMMYIPQTGGEYQEPHECLGCEREGPFRLNNNESEFIDTQEFTLRDTNPNLTEGQQPADIEVHLSDDIVGVTAGDYVTVIGVLHMEQQGSNDAQYKFYLDGVNITESGVPSPTFESENEQAISMKSYLRLAGQTLATLPETTREPATKAKLITPLIEALGWDKFDNDEFRIEYTDSKTDRRVDYALFACESESPDILVEAKQLGKPLERCETQIYDYLRLFSAEYGVLTNGESHRVYHNHPQSEPEMVAELGLHDISDAAIISELQRSAFSD